MSLTKRKVLNEAISRKAAETDVDTDSFVAVVEAISAEELGLSAILAAGSVPLVSEPAKLRMAVHGSTTGGATVDSEGSTTRAEETSTTS